MEWVLTLPFIFAGVIIFCFMECGKFRKIVEGFWAWAEKHFFGIAFCSAVILFLLDVLCYERIFFNEKKVFDFNGVIAISTILALLYTIKIHKDRQEFDMKLALRKERLELIEEIKKEFDEMIFSIEYLINIYFNNLTSHHSSFELDTSLFGFDILDESNKAQINYFYMYVCMFFASLNKENSTSKIMKKEIHKYDDSLVEKSLMSNYKGKDDTIKKKLESLYFENYDMEALFSTQKRYELFKKFLDIMTKMKDDIEGCLPNINKENDKNKWDIDLALKQIENLFLQNHNLWDEITKYSLKYRGTKSLPEARRLLLKENGIKILAYYLGNFFSKNREEIKKMKEEMQAKFNAEIQKLEEQLKLNI